MNERIEELAKQATTRINTLDDYDHVTTFESFDKEKFAELVWKDGYQAGVTAMLTGVLEVTKCEKDSR